MKLDKLLSFWEKDKDNLELIKEIISQFSANKDTTQAETFVSKLSPNLQIHPQVVWLLGQTFMYSGDTVKAKPLFESLPEDSQYQRSYSIALCCYFEGDFQHVITTIEGLVNTPNLQHSPQFILLLSKSYYQLGKIEQARDYAKSIDNAHTPEHLHAELYGLLAMLALDLTNIDESREYAEKSLLLEPAQHDALLAKSSCLIFEQSPIAAEELCVLGTRRFTTSGRFWSVLSQAQMLGGKHQEALNSITRATELMPEHVGSWHIKAWLELISESFSEAKQSFTSALDLDRNFADSHGGLAVIAFHEGQFSKCETLAKKAMRLNPNSFSGIYALSLLANRDGDKDKSSDLVQSILNQESHLSGISHNQLISLIKAKK